MNETSSSARGNEKVETAARAAIEELRPRIDELARVARDVGGEIAAYVKKRPVAAVGVAAGAGFVVGTLVGSRIARVALTMAAGYAVQEIVEGALGEGGVKKVIADELARRRREGSSSS